MLDTATLLIMQAGNGEPVVKMGNQKVFIF